MNTHESLPRRFTLQHVEALLLALTLLATVVISALTLHQTTRHFRIERTSGFVARLNSAEMVNLRENVDRWLESGQKPADLFDLVEEARPESATGRSILPAERSAAESRIAELRTLANYFEELGAALRLESVDEEYARVLIGGLCVRYGTALEPFILEMRNRRERPHLYEEVLLLRRRMEVHPD